MGVVQRIRDAIDRAGFNPVCERVDHPGGVKCGRPADSLVTDPRCGHDTYLCEAHLADAGKAGVWVCPTCGTVTDCARNPITFKVWVPKGVAAG